MALSFIRTADEVREAQALSRSLGRSVPLIVKLEKGEAIDNLEAILQVADGVMVARGDLGVELAPETVPMLQKRIIQRANQRGIPVITATQMLESMVTDETPTRAEANDVANAVWDGTDAVMLSAETTIGRHPLLRRAHDGPHRARRRVGRVAAHRPPTARNGRTTTRRPLPTRQGCWRRISTPRPSSASPARATPPSCCRAAARDTPIYAFSPDAQVCRRLALWWGVTPVHQALADDLESNIAVMERHLVEQCGAPAGGTLVITGSHPFEVGVHTNFVQVPHRRRDLMVGGAVSCCLGQPVQPNNREPLSAERFLSEAAQLHQTWIRRFDAQHRRRPRPPEIEAERLRLVRRLQLVQRLQAEASKDDELTTRLRELTNAPREARLVEGDQPFLTALLQTWEAAQLPQASTIAAGANPPKPSGTVEFRW